MSDTHKHVGRVDDSLDAPREGVVSTRRRGAPLGNHNALRHGYYARNLGQISLRQYDEAEMRNLLGEAAMLKDFMFKLYNDNIDSTDKEAVASTLRILSLAGIALSRVLQTHRTIRIYSAEGDSSLKNVLAALDEETRHVENLDL
jgi:hypothetical protein